MNGSTSIEFSVLVRTDRVAVTLVLWNMRWAKNTEWAKKIHSVKLLNINTQFFAKGLCHWGPCLSHAYVIRFFSFQWYLNKTKTNRRKKNYENTKINIKKNTISTLKINKLKITIYCYTAPHLKKYSNIKVNSHSAY